MAEILDEVLLLIEHRSLPANLKVVARVRRHARDPRRSAAAPPGDLESLPQRGAGDARRGRAPGGRAPLRERGGRLQISITDTGQGIADGDLPHIFEPFFSTKPEGSGIGLALVYRVVEEHGGSIEVRSRVGEGTTFILTLPRPTGPPGVRQTFRV